MPRSLEIDGPEGLFRAYVAEPAADRAPAVVVIQEIFGVNAGMRAVCDALAAEGFLAICPDLFWRFEPGIQLDDHSEADWKKALDYYQRFDRDAGVRDIGATVEVARRLPDANGKVGVMGFCLGGLLTFLTTARSPVDAGVSYYGGGIDGYLDEGKKISRPLLMHLAGEDEFMDSAARARIKDALGSLPQIEIHLYPGCHHAFARPNGDHYDADSAAQANRRSYDFLRDRLT